MDCDLLAKVYINLIDQKEPSLDFHKLDKNSNLPSSKDILYFKKVIEPTEQELKNHNEYLKKDLRKNYFN